MNIPVLLALTVSPNHATKELTAHPNDNHEGQRKPIFPLNS